jgi:hypothetical protein
MVAAAAAVERWTPPAQTAAVLGLRALAATVAGRRVAPLGPTAVLQALQA